MTRDLLLSAMSNSRQTTVNGFQYEEHRGRQKKTCHTISTSSCQSGKEKRTEDGNKTKTNGSLTYESSDANEENEVCIVCLSTWSAGKREEEINNKLAHAVCTDLGKNSTHICHNCNSDADCICIR